MLSIEKQKALLKKIGFVGYGDNHDYEYERGPICVKSYDDYFTVFCEYFGVSVSGDDICLLLGEMEQKMSRSIDRLMIGKQAISAAAEEMRREVDGYRK